MSDEYRFEHGKLYKLNDAQEAYVFVGAFSAPTKAGAIRLHKQLERREQEEIEQWS